MISRVQSYFRSHATQIGLVVITIAFMLILWLQAYATSKLQTEVQTQQQVLTQTRTILGALSSNAKQRTQQINSINDHISCIFAFFTLDPKARAATVVKPGEQTCTLQTATGTVVVPLISPTPSAISPATPAPVTPAPTAFRGATPTPSWSPSPAATPTPKAVVPALVAPAPKPMVLQRVLNFWESVVHG